MKNDYENKFLYRLVKVTYYVVLLIAIGLSVMGAWYSRPIKYVDDTKSTLTCIDINSSYSLDQADVNAYDINEKLTTYNDKAANDFCKETIISKVLSKYSDQEKELHRAAVVESVSIGYEGYSLNLVEKTQGSFIYSILWILFGIGGSFVLLNIIREALNYLFLGKAFDLEWLKSILH